MDRLDSFDRKILSTLAADGRLSFRELADRIHLSLTPTLRRVRRLEEEGYIEAYRATLSEKKLLGGMSVFMWVSLSHQSAIDLAAFENAIVDLPEVMECFIMTGDADYMLRVVVPELEEYERVVHAIAAMPGIANIRSSFALRPVIRRRSPMVMAA